MTNLKFQAREYPSGEVVLIFPEVSASPDASMAVGYMASSSFYPVDPAIVVKNTVPAKNRGKVKITLLELSKLELDFEYEEDTSKLAPAKAREAREADPKAYLAFPRLKHQYG